MMEAGKFNLPQKSLMAMLICFGLVLIFVFATVYPQTRTLAQLDEKIGTLRPRLAEHEALWPFYERLRKQMDLAGAKPEGTKVGTARTCENVYNLPNSFEEYAGIHRLRIVNIHQDLDAMADPDGKVKMDLYAQGDFFDFREFLLEICELPCLENIETLGIQALKDSDDLELRMRLCFNRK